MKKEKVEPYIKRKLKVDSELNEIVREGPKNGFIAQFYPILRDEEVDGGENSPVIKSTKEMRDNFDKLEILRESLPSKTMQVMLEAGKDIMRQSYLRDLELHKKLTNMKQIAGLTDE